MRDDIATFAELLKEQLTETAVGYLRAEDYHADARKWENDAPDSTEAALAVKFTKQTLHERDMELRALMGEYMRGVNGHEPSHDHVTTAVNERLRELSLDGPEGRERRAAVIHDLAEYILSAREVSRDFRERHHYGRPVDPEELAEVADLEQRNLHNEAQFAAAIRRNLLTEMDGGHQQGEMVLRHLIAIEKDKVFRAVSEESGLPYVSDNNVQRG